MRRVFQMVTLVILGSACTATPKGKPAAADAGAQNEGGSGEVGGEAGMSDDFAALIAQYPTWTKRTDKPLSISTEIFGLCRAPTVPEQKFADSEHGKGRFLLDWLNPGAVTGLADRGAKPFPVGSAIVKEKLIGTATGYELAARGIMVKRAPGFDTQHGDWEYAYWEAATGIVAGKEQSQYCAGCHASTQSTDFVFVDDSWRRP